MIKLYLYEEDEIGNIVESFDESKLFATISLPKGIELKNIGEYHGITIDNKLVEFYIFKKNFETNQVGIVRV